MILDYAVREPTTTCINLTTAYRPPVAIQINRKMRDKFVSVYYRATTFRVRSQTSGNINMLPGFLASLPAAHLHIMPSIEIDTSDEYGSFIPGKAARDAENMRVSL